MVQKVVKKIEDADVIIAPIADNKMFYVMSQFAEGEINADVAIHSLSASRLGLQYIFKTDKALKNLIPIERYYLSVPEREDCRRALTERGYEIDTKLKLNKYTTSVLISICKAHRYIDDIICQGCRLAKRISAFFVPI